ncbi:MAG: PAS domain S-box protein [bacterium]|nr:PAS domain S-box protein [bacterium]
MSGSQHSLLKRQLKKYFNNTIPEELQGFIRAVDTAYYQFDEDREMLERSMELSSQELLEANSELQALFSALPDIFFRVSETGTIVDSKASNMKDFVLPPNQLVGKRIQDIPDTDVAQKFQETLRQLQKSKEISSMEYTLEQNEKKSYYEARFLPFLKDHAIIIIRNITAKKQAEKELASEKERLSVTLCSIGDAVITTDTAGNIVLMNPVAEQLTGFTMEDAVGRPLNKVFRVVHHVSRERRKSIVENILHTGRTIREESKTVLLAGDGGERLIAHSGAPIIDNENNIIGVVLAIRDITERQKMEEELLKAQKLESIGILAGGIAHDFNNVLTAVLGNITLAKKLAGEDHKILKRLENAEKASNRTKELIQKLVTFATGGTPIRKVTVIDNLLINTIGFTLAGSNVKPEFSIKDGLWPVNIDESQVAQAVNNVVLNGVEAMLDGGSLEVTAENYRQLEGCKHPPDPGDYVKVTIRDNGVGISPLNMTKIFDPYFSTKEDGSGLGLTSSYSIVRKHGGHMEVESFLNEGTTVSVFLPASEDEVEEVGQLDYQKDARILIMDDCREVRETAGDILQHEGFRVDFALDGAEAIDMFQKSLTSGDTFDLIIMDLTIPGGMGGKDAVREVKKISPNVRVIVSSGYSNDPVMAFHLRYGFSGIVSKPYIDDELVQTVKRVLSLPDQ